MCGFYFNLERILYLRWWSKMFQNLIFIETKWNETTAGLLFRKFFVHFVLTLPEKNLQKIF